MEIKNMKSGPSVVLIPAGKFRMGSPEAEVGRYPSEGIQHDVEVGAFYLGRMPVTNREYEAFVKRNSEVSFPACWRDRRFNRSDQPVVGVSWEEARAFCAWAGGRLPTETEWEYACRAGTTTRFWSGERDQDLDRVAWHAGNTEQSAGAKGVGQRPPNPFGLWDMHGNVAEWCMDAWSGSYSELWKVHPGAFAPDGPVTHHVCRGGSFQDSARNLRSAARLKVPVTYRDRDVGFRIAADVPAIF